MPDTRKLKIIGHRGYGPSNNFDIAIPYPENTLLAFKYALDSGADGIELDIFMSKDRFPVVIHDKRLHEHVVPDQIPLVINKNLSDFTFSELQKFNVGQEQKIPHLENIFELFSQYSKKLIMNLDVKDPDSVSAILDIIQKYQSEQFNHDIIISSYKWDILKDFRRKDQTIKLVPAIKTAMLFGIENVDPKTYAPLKEYYQNNFRTPIEILHEEIDCYAFDCSITDYTKDMITFVKDKNVGLQLSTGIDRVDAKNTNYSLLQELQESFDIGVPFIICKVDEPDLVQANLLKHYQPN